jgi:hypothetical protein
MSLDTPQRLAALSPKIDDLTRFSERRERFLDMLDFDAFPVAYVNEVSMMDAHLEAELADYYLERHYLEERLAESM